MELTPNALLGDQTTTTITFSLEHPEAFVHLEKIRLKITSKKQEQGIGSTLHYTDAANKVQEAKEIIQQLTHFTSIKCLNAQNASFKIDLQVVPGEGVNSLAYQVALTDDQDKVFIGTELTWHKQKQLVLTQTSPANIEGENKEIRLTIHNPNPFPTEKGKLKLRVKRTNGKEAIINQAVTTKDQNVYEIALPSLTGDQKIEKTLRIDPKKDLKTNFKIQLDYQGQPQGEPATISWQQGLLLVLKADIVDTPRTLICDITNQGTVPLRGVKLQYRINTPGIKLKGKMIEEGKWLEKGVGNIDQGTAEKTQHLGAIDFGTNDQVEVEFALAYEKLITEKGAPTTYEKETIKWPAYHFTPEDVRLSVEQLYYDAEGEEIVCRIYNQGKDVAKDVQLQYENISPKGPLNNPYSHQVTLNRKTNGKVVKFTIAPGTYTEEQRLPINFFKADHATFKLMPYYKGKPVVQTPNKTIHVQAKEVRMKLVPEHATSENHIALIGGNDLAHLKFEVGQTTPAIPSRSIAHINTDTIYIKVTNQGGNGMLFLLDGTKKIKLKEGEKISVKEQGVTLSVDPAGATSATFDVQLYYVDAEKGDPIRISWQEDQLEIKEFSPFIGHNKTSFTLLNKVGPIDPTKYTIELSTEKEEVQFQLLKLKNDQSIPQRLSGSMGFKRKATMAEKLHMLIGDHPVKQHDQTPPIYLQVTENSNNPKEAKVTVTVKRGTTVLVSDSVQWKEQGINCKIHPRHEQIKNNEQVLLLIQNLGREIALSDLSIKCRSQDKEAIKWQFIDKEQKRKADIGKETMVKLKRIFKSAKWLQEGSSLEFQLAIDPTSASTTYTASITLELYHKEELLDTKTLTWFNEVLLQETLAKHASKFKEVCKQWEGQQSVSPTGHEQFHHYVHISSDYQTQLENIRTEMHALKNKEGMQAFVENTPHFDQLEQNIQLMIVQILNHITHEGQKRGATLQPTPRLQGDMEKIKEIVNRATPVHRSPYNPSPLTASPNIGGVTLSHLDMDPLALDNHEEGHLATSVGTDRKNSLSQRMLIFPSMYVDNAAKNREALSKQNEQTEILFCEEQDRIQELLACLDLISTVKQDLEKRNVQLSHLANSLVDVNVENFKEELKQAQKRTGNVKEQLKAYEKQAVNLLYMNCEKCAAEIEKLTADLEFLKVQQQIRNAKSDFSSNAFSLITLPNDQKALLSDLLVHAADYCASFDQFNALYSTLLAIYTQLEGYNQAVGFLPKDHLSLLKQKIENLTLQKGMMLENTVLEVTDAIVNKGIEELKKLKASGGHYQAKVLSTGLSHVRSIFEAIIQFYATAKDQEGRLHKAIEVREALTQAIIQQAIVQNSR
eukprot:gene573-718_t